MLMLELLTPIELLSLQLVLSSGLCGAQFDKYMETFTDMFRSCSTNFSSLLQTSLMNEHCLTLGLITSLLKHRGIKYRHISGSKFVVHC